MGSSFEYSVLDEIYFLKAPIRSYKICMDTYSNGVLPFHATISINRLPAIAIDRLRNSYCIGVVPYLLSQGYYPRARRITADRISTLILIAPIIRYYGYSMPLAKLRFYHKRGRFLA